MTTQQTGSLGEEIAASYLASKQYEIRERNVHFQKLEIDIVAYDRTEKMMVFAEVKTRGHHSEQYPIHTAIDRRKWKAMRRAVARWVNLHRYEGSGRIDMLSVCEGRVVEHIKDLGSDFY